MTDLTEPAALDRLLAEQDFVRRLARALLFDDHRVDDVVQQTWVAALRNPPGAGQSARPWLARVVRNLASNAVRSERRQRERERAAAREEGMASVDEVLARETERQTLVEAVRAMPEPYRRAVVLRYFEDVAPSEIARRDGVPAATVRSHLKRGLDWLRRDLDRRHGSRRGWCLAFVPLARPGSAVRDGFVGSVTGIGALVIMQKTLLILLAAAALLIGTLWIAGPGGDAPNPAPLQAGVSETAPRAGPDTDPAPPSADTPRVEVPPAASEVAAESQSVAAARAGFRGRVLGPDGEPEAAAVLHLIGIDGLSMFDSPGDLTLHRGEAVTGDDGRFELTGAWPRAVYALKAGVGGPHPLLRLIPRTPGPGEVVDLGDLRMARCGVITGVVTDENDTPVAGAEVWAGDGLAALDGFVHLGHLDARHGGIIALPGPEPGEAPDAFSGRLRRYLGKQMLTRRADLSDVEGLRFSVIDTPGWFLGGLEVLPLRRTRSDADGTFRLEGAVPGANLVAVRHPGFERWSRPAVMVRAGAERPVQVRMRRGTALRGRVVDADGEPVARAEVRVGPLGRRAFRGLAFCEAPVRTGADGAFSVDGLADGTALVAVRRSRDHAWVGVGPVDVDDEVTLELPIACDLDVALTLGEQPFEGDVAFRVLVGPHFGEYGRAGMQNEVPARAAVRAPGKHRIVGLEEGTYSVDVRAEGCAPERVAVHLPRTEPLSLSLRPAIAFDVTVVDEAGAPVEGAAVHVQDERVPDWSRTVAFSDYGLPRWHHLPRRAGVTDAEGALRVDELVAGTVAVMVDHPGFAQSAQQVVLETGRVPAPVVVTLARCGAIEGRLFAAGRPADPAQWAVYASRLDSMSRGGMPWRIGRATLDVDGRFRIEGLSPGRYRVSSRESMPPLATVSDFLKMLYDTVYRGHRITNAVETDVDPGGTASVVFDVDPSRQAPGQPGASLHGTVIVNGRPGAGLRVVDADALDGNATIANTDAQGMFSIDGLKTGERQLHLVGATANDRLWSGDVELKPGKVTRLDIELSTAALRGVVRTPGAEPVVDHQVHAYGEVGSGHVWRFTPIGDDGSFTFVDLPTGKYTFAVTGVDWTGEVEDVEHTVAGTAGVVLPLRPTLVFSGRVAFDGGIPAGLTVWLIGEREHRGMHVMEDGTFMVFGARPGEYALHMTGDAYDRHQAVPGSVDLREGSVRGVVLRPGEPYTFKEIRR